MTWFTVALVLCVSAARVQGATDAFVWCYHKPECNDATWAKNIPQFCNGSRQSPIDIPSAASHDASLTNFTFANFSNRNVFTKMENTGKTVKVSFGSGVGVSGGNLPSSYQSLQFHLHWGNGASVPGSEHTIDGKRYPMEFHIVSLQSKFNGNATAAVATSDGAAALGFMIEADTTTTGQPAAWKTLTDLLQNITESGQSVSLAKSGISLDDLLPGVDRTKYYRYLGSLTTPLCYEAVVWTVFSQPVKVSSDLINMFANSVRIGNSSSIFMRNVYRNILTNKLPVTRSFNTTSTSSGSRLSCSLWLLLLVLAAAWLR